jgi:uncharacterized protein YdeI (BOF family)
MVSWGSPLNAQTTPSTTPDRQAQQPSSTPQTQPTPSPEMPPSSEQMPNAQTPPSQTPDTTAPASGSKTGTPSATGAGETGTQTFSGTVVKQGDKYVLKDDSGKIYDIDHQSDVAKFDGKRVRVQGTLDANGKIMVK